ncbi:MAG: ABC transporter permease [Spirochaetaceae bacterium]|jgi:lipoprotein-releasing system permease protein|nr:ABC transporter permease [Spirochaetaceae bacterium]
MKSGGWAGRAEWIGFVARRYVQKRKHSGGGTSASFFLSVCGIAVGVLALTVILAVMNGFQMGFIESILEISSYHIRVALDGPERAEEAAVLIDNVRSVKSVVPYEELQGIIRGPGTGRQQVAVVRALPADALLIDRGMAEKLIIERGAFNLHDPSAILLGAEAASRLGVRLGETVTLLSLAGILPQVPAAHDNGENGDEGGTLDSSFVVRGIFRSGFYEYDLGWAFIGRERAREMEGGGKVMLGVKIGDRFADREGIALIEKALSEHGINAQVTSWRDYNKAFFGALRTEKLFMFILVGLIFIVVGIQIYQSQRRLVLERSDEIGLLRAVGAGVFDVRCIFALGGLIIGGIGALTGTILAVLIAQNIAALFGVLETVVNFVIELLSGGGRFAVFSPTIFYIKDIPSRLIPQEVLAIFLFGFGSAVLAGWFASKRVTSIKPAEVLRYE